MEIKVNTKIVNVPEGEGMSIFHFFLDFMFKTIPKIPPIRKNTMLAVGAMLIRFKSNSMRLPIRS